MEESPWTCTRTPAWAGSAVFRTAGFLFAQLSTAGDGLRTHCDLFTKQALVRTRNAGVSGDGVNRTRSVKCLQHPAFPLGYVAIGACGRDRTDFRRIKNPPLIQFSFTCTWLGSLESNQVLTGSKPVAVPSWLLPNKLVRAARVERATSAPQTRPSDPLTYARTSLRRRESNSRRTAYEAVVLPLNHSAVVPGERLELPKRAGRL
jgi:hypothetical protein